MEGPTSDILGLDPYTWTLQMDVSNRARPFFNLCRVSSNISDDGHRWSLLDDFFESAELWYLEDPGASVVCVRFALDLLPLKH